MHMIKNASLIISYGQYDEKRLNRGDITREDPEYTFEIGQSMGILVEDGILTHDHFGGAKGMSVESFIETGLPYLRSMHWIQIRGQFSPEQTSSPRYSLEKLRVDYVKPGVIRLQIQDASLIGTPAADTGYIYSTYSLFYGEETSVPLAYVAYLPNDNPVNSSWNDIAVSAASWWTYENGLHFYTTVANINLSAGDSGSGIFDPDGIPFGVLKAGDDALGIHSYAPIN